MKMSTAKHPPGHRGKEPMPSGLGVEERSRRIAEAAYYRAEKRGFCPGCEMDDWLEAEKEIDDQLREQVSP